MGYGKERPLPATDTINKRRTHCRLCRNEIKREDAIDNKTYYNGKKSKIEKNATYPWIKIFQQNIHLNYTPYWSRCAQKISEKKVTTITKKGTWKNENPDKNNIEMCLKTISTKDLIAANWLSEVSEESNMRE